MTSRSRVRAITVALLSVSAAVALSGCTGGSDDAAPSASATPIGTAVQQTCAELLPTSVLAVYGKTFEQDTTWTPAKGTPAATIARQRGRVCHLVATDDPSTTITLAVAHLPEKSLTTLKDALYERGGSVPTYRVEGYYALDDGVGRADAFPDPYWVTTESTLYTEPGGAQPVVDAVRSVLLPSASASPAG
ncbi:hypothetical protein [Curtobacterium sp. MR_MD2014]|uniref:hypothetical protein n=1 Tax=Curtobacterium sp. MR_MD2014 TaxID=1561023 RepID=UPI00052A853B|nr:hypothetical protein [Curtobacterium sp. MR_MD2014]AIV40302.1 hypothetical protein NI26_09145 [Curtobacterium sp. MR_MD2014]